MSLKSLIAALLLQSIAIVPMHAQSSEADDAKAAYEAAQKELAAMLTGQSKPSYERAIFLVENAWHGNRYQYATFSRALDQHTGFIRRIMQNNTDSALMHPQRDLLETSAEKAEHYRQALANYAIFQYMTAPAMVMNGDTMLYHSAYHYSSQDPFGTVDWRNTQVIHLLNTDQGNCFALASLFKIFSDRLHSNATLCTAPGHIYIRHADQKGTLYNVELASQSFPGTGTLETLTYTTDAAAKNNIALRTLNDQQAIALCMVYLAKGYENRFGKLDDGFMQQCADLALQSDPTNLNALLLQASLLQDNIVGKRQSVKLLQGDIDFQRYEALIGHLYSLGYREMPLEMKNVLMKGWKRDSLTIVLTQNHLPKTFAGLGETEERHASLSWGVFDEVMLTKPVERYGRTLFDTKTRKIVGFAKPEIVYNDYDFDPVVFAWNIDPLAHKAPWSSPYSFCEGNPILYLDPDGRFKANFNDEMLRANGLTRTQMVRFESIMNNMSRLLQGNPQAMQVIANTTGRTPEQITRDFSAGNGPEVTINPEVLRASTWGAQIHVDPSIIAHLAAIDPNDKEYLAQQVTGVALTLAHEYGHYGDQQTNGGSNTGQFEVSKIHYRGGGSNTDRIFYTRPSEATGTPNKERGVQPWSISPMGHRGNDIDLLGFGMDRTVNGDGSINLNPSTTLPPTTDGTHLPAAPAQLPDNIRGVNALGTFSVH